MPLIRACAALALRPVALVPRGGRDLPRIVSPVRALHQAGWLGRVLACVLLVGPLPRLSAGGFRSAPVQNTASPAQYVRADFQADLAAAFTNPYDQRQVAVDLVLTSPTGRAITLPAYFESGNSAGSVWRARFAAQETGTYRYVFRLTEAGTVTATSAAGSFTVGPSGKPGFLHRHNNWTFITDSGQPFRGLGENVGWESRSWENTRYSYDLFLAELAEHGANFFRTWSCAWNLPLEWKRVLDTNRYGNTTQTYHPGGVQRLDELVALCEALDLRFMLALDQHGGFMRSGQWAVSNYNVANGGPCAAPADFFTNAEAKAWYRNRLRYAVARWGCSTSIGAWELFNEIDNAAFDEAAKIPADAITAWHAEMSAYLKQIDPYGHLVTTSVSWRDIPGLYDVASIDFNQRHTYNATATIPAVIAQYTAAHAKPFVDGEFAWDWDWNHVTAANGPNFDHDFKYGLWYGLFSPTPIVPMSWWWEFFHERGLIPYLAGVRTISDQMLAAGNGAFTALPVVAGRFHTLAVGCGRTVFVHAHNVEARPATGSVSVALPDAATFTVQAFDPESRSTATVGTVTPAGGMVVIPGVTLAAWEQRVFILSPAMAGGAPAITTPPASRSVPVGGTVTLAVAATGTPAPSLQWERDGTNIPGATRAALTLTNAQPADSGLYAAVARIGDASAASDPAIVGVSTAQPVSGAADRIAEHVRHPNGKTYGQVLLTGSAAAITARDQAGAGETTRTSFLDDDGDIVQVEFAGPGTLSLILDDARAPAEPAQYNQPGARYVQGHAAIVITGATEDTHLTVFTVGRATAFDPTGAYDITQAAGPTNDPARNGSPLFRGREATNYDGIADLAFIAIASANGRFGGVRAANANLYAARGCTGIYAPAVAFNGPVYVGNITASDRARPVLVLGSAGDVRVTGGDMDQLNRAPIWVSGLTRLVFTGGGDSHGRPLEAQSNRGVFQQDGQDVTDRIVVNPSR